MLPLVERRWASPTLTPPAAICVQVTITCDQAGPTTHSPVILWTVDFGRALQQGNPLVLFRVSGVYRCAASGRLRLRQGSQLAPLAACRKHRSSPVRFLVQWAASAGRWLGAAATAVRAHTGWSLPWYPLVLLAQPLDMRSCRPICGQALCKRAATSAHALMLLINQHHAATGPCSWLASAARHDLATPDTPGCRLQLCARAAA